MVQTKGQIIENSNLLFRLHHQRFYPKEFELLHELCKEKFPEEELLPELLTSIIDIEAKAETVSNKRNILNNMEKQLKKCSYCNEGDAENIMRVRMERQEEIS